MKKKVLSLILAVAMIVSLVAVGVVPAAAEETEGVSGGYCDHPEFTPMEGVETNHLMFAMPGAWQNDITKDPKCGGTAGLYWWTGYQTPDKKYGHGWPGYKATKVDEEGVENLYAIDVPTYGNGEEGNATQINWNNFIDGGTETDPDKNPFREAAQQTKDKPCQLYSRYNDYNGTYEKLFRYIYRYNLDKIGVEGASKLDLNADSFWDEINKLSAQYLGETYDPDNIQVDMVMDENELDFSVFGEKYASNFFNEDNVGTDELYPKEDYIREWCISFTFDNMVFIVDFDPAKMEPSPLSQKIGFDGEFYFYYGGGKYGSWPTEELNKEMGGVEGNFMGDYWEKKELPPIPTTVSDPTNAENPTNGDGKDTPTTSGGLNSSSGSDSITTNGSAVQTGSVVFAVAFLTVLVMVAGIVWFARKKKFD